MAQCRVKFINIGGVISSDGWLEDTPLISHWRLDEAEGDTASDNIGGFDGTLHGGLLWQPEGGKLAERWNSAGRMII